MIEPRPDLLVQLIAEAKGRWLRRTTAEREAAKFESLRRLAPLLRDHDNTYDGHE